jgi:DnaK suppressor protein
MPRKKSNRKKMGRRTKETQVKKVQLNSVAEVEKGLEKQEERLQEEDLEVKEEDPFMVEDREVGNSEYEEEAEELIGHERVEAEQGIIHDILMETRLALSKIKLGKYGVCERCGRRIDRARLKAYPQAKYCLECETKQDEKRGS